jgi:hypothetical protein
MMPGSSGWTEQVVVAPLAELPASLVSTISGVGPMVFDFSRWRGDVEQFHRLYRGVFVVVVRRTVRQLTPAAEYRNVLESPEAMPTICSVDALLRRAWPSSRLLTPMTSRRGLAAKPSIETLCQRRQRTLLCPLRVCQLGRRRGRSLGRAYRAWRDDSTAASCHYVPESRVRLLWCSGTPGQRPRQNGTWDGSVSRPKFSPNRAAARFYESDGSGRLGRELNG